MPLFISEPFQIYNTDSLLKCCMYHAIKGNMDNIRQLNILKMEDERGEQMGLLSG